MLRRLLLSSATLVALIALGACTDDSASTGASDSTAPDTGAPDVASDTGPVSPVDAATPDTADVKTTPDTGPTPDAGPVCTGDESCQGALGDLGPCAKAVCDKKTQACVKANIADGAGCEDGDACTIGTFCKAGVCDATTGYALDCSDGKPCTEDVCDPTTGCANPNSQAPCDDSNPCTTEDTCKDGSCAGTPKSCDDDNPCTADTCDKSGECAHVPNSSLCEDGNPCTEGDKCVDGQCQAGAGVCPTCATTDECEQDDDLCNGAAACIEGYCMPDPATVVKCDTSNDTPCSLTKCLPGTGECVSGNLAEGAACSDGDGCTEGETCQGGVCQGGTVVCQLGCDPTDEPGCAGCECEDCVCAIDSFCCDALWDSSCATLCVDDCGQDCGGPVEPNAGCQASTGPGCGGCSCESCVCGSDTFCCTDAWDSQCVSECKACGVTCGGGGDTGGCQTSPAAGCGGCSCEGCVCAQDPYCCDSSWDTTCVNECKGCGTSCGGGGEGGCQESDFPGCGGCACESCVCNADEYCCLFAWDNLCVGQCEDCGSCGTPCVPDCTGKECGSDGCKGTCGACGADESCYDGTCELHCGNFTCEEAMDEDCASCPGDCGECELSNGCAALKQPTCGGCACEACVCEEDAYCCTTGWDAACAQSCLLDCGGCYEHEGCAPHEAAGCDGCACEECVCEKNPYCCETAWDEACVVSCQLDCGETCGVVTCEADLDCTDADPCTVDTCPVPGATCHHEPAESCCAADEECADEDACTASVCTTQGCQTGGHCCTEDAECDDGDPCTVETCGGELCEATWAADDACCPEGPVFTADFETLIPMMLTNSSELGGLSVSTEKAKDGDRALRFGTFGIPGFNFGEATATATTDPLWLPPSYTLSLSFQLIYDTGADADLAIEALTAEGPVALWDSDAVTPGSSWSKQTVDLGALGGQQVRLRFTITANGDAHTGSGLFIDAVTVDSDCFFPICGDGECNGNENCFTCSEDCATPVDCPENEGCDAWEYPTCAGCTCETCVCDKDPSCCDLVWDEECAKSCAADCGAKCGGCAGNCDKKAPEGCWCDASCMSAGDCCEDVCTTCGYCVGQDTCAGACGGTAASGKCACDLWCLFLGDCCDDACSICGICF